MKAGKVLGITAFIIICLFCAAWLSLAVGARQMSLHDVFNALKHSGDNEFSAMVIWSRIPRTIFSLLAGGALGIAGLLMQSITRNPIADPSILGINFGAALAVVCGIAFLNITSDTQYILLAVGGAAVTAVFVYGIGAMGAGGATPLKLALAGTAVSTALTAMVSVIIMPRDNVMDTFRFWQIGSVGGADWKSVAAMLPVFAAGVTAALIIAPALDILALGDEAATGLGTKPSLIRLAGSAAGVLLCGTVTALAGPIGFVGLMIPHLIRLLFQTSMRIAVLLSAAGGALLLTVADVLGRIAGRPGELEVGIVTAFLGAPVFILVAVKSKGGEHAG